VSDFSGAGNFIPAGNFMHHCPNTIPSPMRYKLFLTVISRGEENIKSDVRRRGGHQIRFHERKKTSNPMSEEEENIRFDDRKEDEM
jgi:hypothetical protein